MARHYSRGISTFPLRCSAPEESEEDAGVTPRSFLLVFAIVLCAYTRLLFQHGRLPYKEVLSLTTCRVESFRKHGTTSHFLCFPVFLISIETMDDSEDLSTLFTSREEEEDFIKEANLEELVADYQPSAFSQNKSAWDLSIKFKEARPVDILIGRFVSHPGNVLLRKVIMRNRTYFQSLPQTEQRKIATDALIGFFREEGMSVPGKYDWIEGVPSGDIFCRLRKVS